MSTNTTRLGDADLAAWVKHVERGARKHGVGIVDARRTLTVYRQLAGHIARVEAERDRLRTALVKLDLGTIDRPDQTAIIMDALNGESE